MIQETRNTELETSKQTKFSFLLYLNFDLLITQTLSEALAQPRSCYFLLYSILHPVFSTFFGAFLCHSVSRFQHRKHTDSLSKTIWTFFFFYISLSLSLSLSLCYALAATSCSTMGKSLMDLYCKSFSKVQRFLLITCHASFL